MTIARLRRWPHVDRTARLCHDLIMDLEAARKSFSKRSRFTSKHFAFFGVVGLCLVAGAILHSGLIVQPEQERSAPVAVTPSEPPVVMPAVEATKPEPRPEAEQNAPASTAPLPAGQERATVPPSSPPAQQVVTAPPQPVAPTGNAVGVPEPASETDQQSEPAPPPSDLILVAARPVQVLASPVASAPALYGFPAGRPFRVIGRQDGYAHIQDLRSSASGWIEEAALALPPRASTSPAPVAQPRKSFPTDAAPSRQAAAPKPKTTQDDGSVAADSDVPAQPDRRSPGLFGRGGLFGGIFRNGN
jgi:hypothetical protein